MLKFLYDNTVVPIEGITKTKVWLNSEYKFCGVGDPNFVKVVKVFNSQICSKSVKELELFWNCKDSYYWDSDYYANNVKRYMGLADSVSFSIAFLMHQFYEEEYVIDFLQTLVNLLNKNLNKMNAMEIVSPPCGGKNWFFDSVCTFCVSYGQIQNHNKNSRFSLENAIGKRINMYNEPNFDRAFIETLLMVLAGDPVTAEAKYQSHQPLEKTPVIIMSNVSRFPNTPQWQERIKRYRWRKADMLKGKDYCHPLTFVNLLKYYNIQYD